MILRDAVQEGIDDGTIRADLDPFLISMYLMISFMGILSMEDKWKRAIEAEGGQLREVLPGILPVHFTGYQERRITGKSTSHRKNGRASMTIKVAITGAAGRMGTMVIDAMKAVPENGVGCRLWHRRNGKLLAGGMTVSNASELRDILARKRPDVLIESHHQMKKDAPSGTAMAAVEILKRASTLGRASRWRRGAWRNQK